MEFALRPLATEARAAWSSLRPGELLDVVLRNRDECLFQRRLPFVDSKRHKPPADHELGEVASVVAALIDAHAKGAFNGA